MRILRLLSLSNIVCDRLPIGPRTLALAKHLESGGSVPPIHVKPIGDGTYNILDGRHRFLAFKLLGRTEIEVKYGIHTENRCPCHYGHPEQCPAKDAADQQSLGEPVSAIRRG